MPRLFIRDYILGFTNMSLMSRLVSSNRLSYLISRKIRNLYYVFSCPEKRQIRKFAAANLPGYSPLRDYQSVKDLVQLISLSGSVSCPEILYLIHHPYFIIKPRRSGYKIIAPRERPSRSKQIRELFFLPFTNVKWSSKRGLSILRY